MIATLFLPGMLCTSELWANQLRALEDAVSVELPEAESVTDAAAAVLAVAPDEFIAGGHSLGAIIALEMARSSPDRVIGLALIHGTGRAPSAGTLAFWDDLERLSFSVAVRTYVTAVLPQSPTVGSRLAPTIERMARATGRERFERQLAVQRSRTGFDATGVCCPTLVVAGADDAVASPRLQRELASAIRSSDYIELAGCGHFAPLEQPDALTHRLREFIVAVQTEEATMQASDGGPAAVNC